MEKRLKNQSGFTLMVAMLVSSIVIIVGLGVSSIIFRQFNLAILSRESQSAFYAADTLVECILYWDMKGKVFEPYDSFNPANLTNLVCDHTDPPSDEDVTINIVRKAGEADGGVEIIPCDAGIRTYKSFETTLNLRSVKGINTPVAYATIVKRQSCEAGDLYTILTQIDTNGYNSNRVGETRRIERGLGLTY